MDNAWDVLAWLCMELQIILSTQVSGLLPKSIPWWKLYKSLRFQHLEHLISGECAEIGINCAKSYAIWLKQYLSDMLYSILNI